VHHDASPGSSPLGLRVLDGLRRERLETIDRVWVTDRQGLAGGAV
jgi:hypothetical protein